MHFLQTHPSLLMDLTFQRCLLHADREAIARCPACANYFCRECITEHEGRFLCSNCLQKRSTTTPSAHRTAGWFTAAAGLVIGWAVAWLFFYLIGQLLILIPPNLHDITYLRNLGQ
jgi:hypothetical protein